MQRPRKYQAACDELLKKGLAYRCYCTPEEVEKMRDWRFWLSARRGTMDAAETDRRGTNGQGERRQEKIHTF